MQNEPFQEYCLAPELRRCCWWFLCCAPVLAVVWCWVVWFVEEPDPFGIVLSVLLLTPAIIGLHWRLRIDEHGIARRLLFRWNRWTWADLANGRVRKLYIYTLHDRERPWWCRRLRLGSMSLNDIQEVSARINEHYRLPPPPEVPDTLTLKCGLRRSVTLDRSGIHLLVRGTPREYPWAEVQNVHVTRMDPLRRDFTTLTILLPDQELELKLVSYQGGTSPIWSGASAEEVNEILTHHLSPEQIDTHILGQVSTNRKYLERKLEDARKLRRAFVQMTIFFSIVFLGFFGWKAAQGEFTFVIGMGTMLAIPIAPLWILIDRAQRKRIVALTAELDEMKV